MNVDDDCLHSLRMCDHQAHADRPAVILLVKHVAPKLELLGEITNIRDEER